jgi:hydrogenase maturation factor
MPAQGTQPQLSTEPLPGRSGFFVSRDLVATRAEPIGKVPQHVLEKVILPHLGASGREVLVGPRHGADAAVLDVGGGQVMAVTTDPFFVMPELGWDRAAWFAVHIVASDAATTGLKPAYIALDLNLPLEMPDRDIESLWLAVDDTCRELGVAIVTGHTGRYEGCRFPMLGGATVLASGSKDSYVTPAMARTGDAIVLTKGAAIETTGMFGVTFPELLTELVGVDLARRAFDIFESMTVVPDAAVAVEAGGVTAMHDATERGVLGALVELAQAANAGIVVEQDSVPLRPETGAVCRLFGIDPYVASSEGTLIIACRPSAVPAICERLSEAGTVAVQVGELVPHDEGMKLFSGGAAVALEMPEVDPFWPAYSKALEERDT